MLKSPTAHKLTAAGAANLAEAKRLREAAEALHKAGIVPPEIEATLLWPLLNDIDDAFGPNDTTKIEALCQRHELFGHDGVVWAVHLNGVAGDLTDTAEEALLSWSIAARQALREGRAA